MSNDELNVIVPDTSAIIEGIISNIIKEKDLDYPEVIVPEAVVAELEHQANAKKTSGFNGLNELQKLQELEYNGDIAISFKGKRPSYTDIKFAKSGEIDNIIRDVARSEFGTLITCDKVQAETAQALGISVIYYKQTYENIELPIAELFDEETMSIHLKEDVVPMAKKGRPGHIELVELSEEPLTYNYLENLANLIIEKEKTDKKTYLESNKDGSTVIQSGPYRISIAQPPFAEAFEITAVRPVAKVSLEDYRLSEKLMKRLTENAEGILVSGSPGAGKSTFVQSLAEFYSENLNKVVKTMESPRDLQVSNKITQYSPLEGSMENTADVLLLVRPDFTVYDELRKTSDFNIFADMRLSGVGMIGVVHATRPIDAIQRIASRVELGVIPSVVDTSIYIEDGKIKEIYEAKMTVKVPYGMEEADLARPVIEIRDFETGQLKHEIYTYGEQTIVMDVDLVNESNAPSKSAVDRLAEKQILKEIKKYVKRSRVEVEVISPERANIYINEEFIPKIIGKNGKRIADIEKDIGISLGVEPLEKVEKHQMTGETLAVDIIETKKQFILAIGKSYGNKNFDVFVDGEYLLTATTSKSGEIKLKKGIELAEFIEDALDYNMQVTAIMI